MDLDELEEGDTVLFSDRKRPLEVVNIDDRVTVRGPNGADYLLWEADNGKLLYAREGNERYASYAEDLRKVGEWKRKEDRWVHTDTGRELRVTKKDTGFWSIRSSPEDLVEVPKYGYTEKEQAVDDVRKFTRDNPEG